MFPVGVFLQLRFDPDFFQRSTLLIQIRVLMAVTFCAASASEGSASLVVILLGFNSTFHLAINFLNSYSFMISMCKMKFKNPGRDMTLQSILLAASTVSASHSILGVYLSISHLSSIACVSIWLFNSIDTTWTACAI